MSCLRRSTSRSADCFGLVQGKVENDGNTTRRHQCTFSLTNPFSILFLQQRKVVPQYSSTVVIVIAMAFSVCCFILAKRKKSICFTLASYLDSL